LPAAPAAAQIALPAGFEAIPLTPPMEGAVAMAFAPDGRIFIAHQNGLVQVVRNGAIISTFIDLSQEVNSQIDRGLLGIALDPNFLTNRFVYLLYTVDRFHGEPDGHPAEATFARLTRYRGSLPSGGNVANLTTRTVLIGAVPSAGIPCCWASHTIGALRFGNDGSLFLASGDSARFDFADGGGLTPGCFDPGMFPRAHDVGAFRAQALDSLSGKILRVDPATGGGLPDNPFWDGAATSNRSRVWASGLRNPYRFAVRPGSAAGTPGALYLGDVGWENYEEINVARGGENFGWPCFEGVAATPFYDDLTPPAFGCETIETPGSPGPLAAPLLRWHHAASALSFPANAYVGFCATGGVFAAGNADSGALRDGFFFADHTYGWIKVLRVDANDQFVSLSHFATGAGGPVDFAIDPLTGEVAYLALFAGRVYRIQQVFRGGDLNQDGAVNVADLLVLVSVWGPCPGGVPQLDPPCPGDLNGSGNIDVTDLLEVIFNWG